MGTPWYATREMLAGAADVKASAGMNTALDSALRSATESVNGQLARPRGLWPTVATYSFDWPADPRSRAWRLWLNERTLISITSATSAGVAVTGLIGYPRSGPPYEAVETDRGGAAVWGYADTPQNALTITGVWGYRDQTGPAGTLAAALTAGAVVLRADPVAAAVIGVGDLLRIDDERLIVTGRGWADSVQDVGGAGLTAQNSARTLTVADGALFAVGERLLIHGERLLVTDIAGDDLTVERAVDGSVLAAHAAGTRIYAPRELNVERGALGTTAAEHLDASGILRWEPPALATELCLAEALNTIMQRQSAYARVSGSGENAREFVGRSLKDIRLDARRALGRRSRTLAV